VSAAFCKNCKYTIASAVTVQTDFHGKGKKAQLQHQGQPFHQISSFHQSKTKHFKNFRTKV